MAPLLHVLSSSIRKFFIILYGSQRAYVDGLSQWLS